MNLFSYKFINLEGILILSVFVVVLYMRTLQEKVLIVRPVFEERLPTRTHYLDDPATWSAARRLLGFLMMSAKRQV